MARNERLPIHSAQPGNELGEGLPSCVVCGDETRHMCLRCLKAICLADDLDTTCHVPMHPTVAPKRHGRWWLNDGNS